MARPDEPQWVRFVTGSMASCTAEVVTLPIDITKVRLQVQRSVPGEAKAYKGMLDAALKIGRKEGLRGFYKGSVPALLRQGSYSGMRMGFYEPIRNYIAGDQEHPSFFRKFLAGGTAGGSALSIASPAELVKIRMQADAKGTRYKGTMDAFRSIVRERGVLGLWQGVGPNIQRAILVNAAELGTYDHAKMTLVEWGMPQSSVVTHTIASLAAGFAAAFASTPVEVAKNRIMNMPGGPNRLYKNMFDCMYKTARQEGPLALYKGFIPGWLRLGPWCTVMFICYEQYRQAASAYVWDRPGNAMSEERN